MNKITILGATAALTFGLACGVSAQKKGVEFKGPPLSDKEKPKPKKEKSPPQDLGKNETATNEGPQSGQAAGFGVGRPGGDGRILPTVPPLQNPPDTILPPIGEPVGNQEGTSGEVKSTGKPSGMEARTDSAIGPPVKNQTPTTGTPTTKNTSKAKRPRRVKKGR